MTSGPHNDLGARLKAEQEKLPGGNVKSLLSSRVTKKNAMEKKYPKTCKNEIKWLLGKIWATDRARGNGFILKRDRYTLYKGRNSSP